MKSKHFFKVFGSMVFSMFLVAAPVLAAEVISPDKNNPTVTLGSQETHKNLYVAGATVTVNSMTAGDLVAAGGTVVVVGNVEQEAIAAGGTLDFSANIGGTARLAGGNITVSGPVGGDLVIGGGNINITGKASVAGDLLVAGGNVVVDAPVQGDIRIAGGTVTLNNKVGGRVYVRASRSLVIGSSAVIDGSIEYSGPQEATVNSGAKISRIKYILVVQKNYQKQIAGIITLAFLIKLLAWIIAAFVVVRLRKNLILSLVEDIKQKPWGNLGIGVLAAIITPIAVVLLFITLVGYYLAIMLGLIYALLLVAGNLFASIVFGYLILSRLNKPGELMADWQAILIGVVIWLVLAFIPFLGWLIMAAVFLMVFGAGVKKIKQSF